MAPHQLLVQAQSHDYSAARELARFLSGAPPGAGVTLGSQRGSDGPIEHPGLLCLAFGFGDGGVSLPLQVRPGHSRQRSNPRSRSRISDRGKLFGRRCYCCCCCWRVVTDTDNDIAIGIDERMNVIDNCHCQLRVHASDGQGQERRRRVKQIRPSIMEERRAEQSREDTTNTQ